MSKIHERYINHANLIRNEYINTINEISQSEEEINVHKDKIKELMIYNEEYVKENSDKDLDIIKSALRDDLLEIDSKIEKIVSKLTPYLNKLEKLQKESKELFRAIKDKYPQMSEQDIQKEILFNIKK